MFDDQIDKVETDADNEIKNLEEQWSESKIAEMVEQALNTGVFTSIDGEIKSLDAALMEFANNSSEYFGVMGNSLKEELLNNLNVALATVQNIKDITSETIANTGSLSYVSMPKNSTSASMGYIPPSDNKINDSIKIGDTNITIQGNADENVVAKIEDLLKEHNKKIYIEIMKNVK